MEPNALTVEIAKLELKPGQVLVCHVPGNASHAEIDIIKTKLDSIMPAGVLSLVVRGDVKFTVIEAEQ